ncbi:MAG: hypothetical protein WC755_01580 [Candidatus Woesearchaeota archaeon]|jgi:hypothetical protein
MSNTIRTLVAAGLMSVLGTYAFSENSFHNNSNSHRKERKEFSYAEVTPKLQEIVDEIITNGTTKYSSNFEISDNLFENIADTNGSIASGNPVYDAITSNVEKLKTRKFFNTQKGEMDIIYRLYLSVAMDTLIESGLIKNNNDNLSIPKRVNERVIDSLYVVIDKMNSSPNTIDKNLLVGRALNEFTNCLLNYWTNKVLNYYDITDAVQSYIGGTPNYINILRNNLKRNAVAPEGSETDLQYKSGYTAKELERLDRFMRILNYTQNIPIDFPAPEQNEKRYQVGKMLNATLRQASQTTERVGENVQKRLSDFTK